MPKLSWNEIRARAAAFSHVWSSATREQADKQTFWNEFFNIFDIPRRTVASFEEPVRRLRGTYGFIDLLWKGKVLIEHKTAGASLEAAQTQAFDYIQDLQTVGRGDEVPRYILLSDFQRFALYDLEPDDKLDLPLFRDRYRYRRVEFPLADLHNHVRAFAFIPGYEVATPRPHDQLNLKAVAIMAGVHDALKKDGYAGHDLERLLVRILFCLFAESTGIFEPESFRLYIENRTHPDGNDLGARLSELFAVLDKEEAKRQSNLDETLKAFPYVNGELFRERLDFPAFDGPMRKAILEAANFDWSRISPAIFGALFQEVMKPADRRKIGAHYTSERDILKVIHPLFLDKLREEFQSIDKDRSSRRAARLEEFRVRLTKLKFLDPACGCGNFLVIAYRELRALELDVLKAQHSSQQAFTLDEVNRLSQVDVHQFYGIEIEEWPARIAEVALWLMDHQSNLRILEAFSQPFLRLPLKNSPHIHIGNALRTDWNDLLPAQECSYILGNPPFVGAMLMSPRQREDVALISRNFKSNGVLDYVCAWYLQAARYIQETRIPVGFVSTNSLSQGEQVAILWTHLFREYHLKILFAYPTFVWESEAKGKAHVHVIIVGFGSFDSSPKLLFADGALPTEADNISPYLVAGSDICISNRSTPISDVPQMRWGSQPRDGGHLVLSDEQRRDLIASEPGSRKWIRPFVGAEELLKNTKRWCLWLPGITPAELNALPTVRAKVTQVQHSRLESKAASTRERAKTPTLFAQIAQPEDDYLLVPLVTSERRPYIPTAFYTKRTIASNLCALVPGATIFHFGILTSSMHMAWMRQVAGRLESRYRYSKDIVYNNFPWPVDVTRTKNTAIEHAAQDVLAARSLHPTSTLSDLYDPVSMPPELTKAHGSLDRAVEASYRKEPFTSDRERVEFLFTLYEQLAAPLLPANPKRKRRGSLPAQPVPSA